MTATIARMLTATSSSRRVNPPPQRPLPRRPRLLQRCRICAMSVDRQQGHEIGEFVRALARSGYMDLDAPEKRVGRGRHILAALKYHPPLFAVEDGFTGADLAAGTTQFEQLVFRRQHRVELE